MILYNCGNKSKVKETSSTIAWKTKVVRLFVAGDVMILKCLYLQLCLPRVDHWKDELVLSLRTTCLPISFTKLIQDTTSAYIRNNKRKIIFLVGICAVKAKETIVVSDNTVTDKSVCMKWKWCDVRFFQQQISFTKLIQDTTSAYIRNNKEKIIFPVGICAVKAKETIVVSDSTVT